MIYKPNNQWLDYNLKPLLNEILNKLNTITSLLGAGGAGTLLADGSTGAIAKDVFNTIASYTNSTGSDKKITYITASGTADAEFQVLVDTDNTVREYRTSEQQRTLIIDTPIVVPNGSTIYVKVKHYKNQDREFSGSILGV